MWSCFRDANLEERYRADAMVTTRASRFAMAKVFTAVVPAWLAANYCLRQQWTLAETSICSVCALYFAVACLFASEPAEKPWPYCTHANIMMTLGAVMSSYQQVDQSYRIAHLVGGEAGRRVLEGKNDCDLGYPMLSLSVCVILTLMLIQEIDLGRYVFIHCVSFASHLLWHKLLPLPGDTGTFMNATTLHFFVCIVLVLIKAQMNHASRIAFMYGVTLHENACAQEEAALKAKLAEAAQVARSRLIRVVSA